VTSCGECARYFGSIPFLNAVILDFCKPIIDITQRGDLKLYILKSSGGIDASADVLTAN